jgi:hypothetical protein
VLLKVENRQHFHQVNMPIRLLLQDRRMMNSITWKNRPYILSCHPQLLLLEDYRQEEVYLDKRELLQNQFHHAVSLVDYLLHRVLLYQEQLNGDKQENKVDIDECIF